MKLELLPRTDLAVRTLRLLSDGSRRTAEQIATAVDSTPRFIPHVMSPLVAGGWVSSARGPTGGYKIERAAEQASILEVIEAVEGPTSTQRCVLRGTPCPTTEQCALHEAWSRAREALTKELNLIPVIQEDRP